MEKPHCGLNPISTQLPRVSVVIPTYNHAHFLQKALESVQAQTVTDWEAIVINDYSPDNTIQVVEGFADPRIRLENHHSHKIIATSRNLGIRLARGTYVAFLDSDDLWYPRKLELCLASLAKGKDLVCHSVRWVGTGWARTIIYGPEHRATYESLLFQGNSLGTSAVVVRRDLLLEVGGFSEDPAIVIAEDYELWLRLTEKELRVGFLRDVLADYRVHDANQSKDGLRNVNATLKVVNDHLVRKGITSGQKQWRVRRRKALIYFHGARLFYFDHQYNKAMECFWHGFRCWPFLLKLYPAMLMNWYASWRANRGNSR